MLIVIQFILLTESSVYRKNLKFLIIQSNKNFSSFLENPRTVENSIDSLNEKMKLLQAELSKSEDITSVENINKTPNRDSIGVQMLGELLDLELS